VKFDKASLSEVMEVCLRGQQVSYAIDDMTIVIQRKDALLPKKDLQAQVQFKGVVKSTEGELLAGASVRIKGAATQTKTNDNGEFVLSSAATEVTLAISHLGYASMEVKAKSGQTVIVQLSLLEQTIEDV